MADYIVVMFLRLEEGVDAEEFVGQLAEDALEFNLFGNEAIEMGAVVQASGEFNFPRFGSRVRKPE